MYRRNNNNCVVTSSALLLVLMLSLPQDAVSKSLLTPSDNCLVSKLSRRQCWDSVMLSSSNLFTCRDVETLIECGEMSEKHCQQGQGDRKSTISALISMFGNETGCQILQEERSEEKEESRVGCTRKELSGMSAQAEFCAELEVSLIAHQIQMGSGGQEEEEGGHLDLCAVLEDVETNCVEWIFGRLYSDFLKP